MVTAAVELDVKVERFDARAAFLSFCCLFRSFSLCFFSSSVLGTATVSVSVFAAVGPSIRKYRSRGLAEGGIICRHVVATSRNCSVKSRWDRKTARSSRAVVESRSNHQMD